LCTAKHISSTVGMPTFIFSVEMEMFWIPVMFVCLISGDCSFLQGKPAYTEAGCMEQLTPLVALLKEDVRVADFNGTCVVVQAI
jgi:hypothetical protein